MSAAANAAGFLYASGILGRRRLERDTAQPKPPVAPKPVQVTYKKSRA